MKAVMVMFDSLNRHMLPPYGCEWTHAPNFRRLAAKTLTFDRCYVGSMPCMPARLELHTGRYNFLHRGWGPLSPYDDSTPEILTAHGVYTHLASDHYHYWEDGGASYHTRYSTWESFRGQEGDPWIGQVQNPDIPPGPASRSGTLWRQDWVNREHMPREEDHSLARTFAAGMDFIRRNAAEDRWFLQLECFDPHEPYFAPQKYKDLYPEDYSGPHFDWPPYRGVAEPPEQVAHARREYAALLSMCDAYLGKVLDLMDQLGLWKDTMLIVNTDHGFLLGEHDSWGKGWCPWYQEHANTPLFVWDPRCGLAGQRRSSLVQTIDLPATLLEYFGVPLPPDMQGRPLRQTLAADAPVRETGLFGIFGAQVNITDGRYVYMRGPVRPDNQPLFQYTLMPAHMSRLYGVQELRTATLAPPFAFTKGCPSLRIQARGVADFEKPDPRVFRHWLFDVQEDSRQQHPLADPGLEQRMIDLLRQAMKDNDAPADQYERLGLARP